jgi:uncharacterized membrane protein YqaE (UPF0057 family)
MPGKPITLAYSTLGRIGGILMSEGMKDIFRLIFAILLPPLGVFLQVGLGKHFWINIVLTLLGYLPGIIHAVWVIAKVGGMHSIEMRR